MSWTTRALDKEGREQTLAAAAGGAVLIQTERAVRAVDGRTGQVVWSRSLNELSAATPDGEPVVSVDSTDDTVYVSQGTGFTALDPGTGELRWSRDLPKPLAAVDDGGALSDCHRAIRIGNRICAATDPYAGWDGGEPTGTLLGIDADGGRVRWQHDPVESPHLLGADAEVLVLVEGTTLRALDPDTGREYWHRAFDEATQLSSESTLHDGTVYLGAEDRLHAIDAHSGRRRSRAVERGGAIHAVDIVGGRLLLHTDGHLSAWRLADDPATAGTRPDWEASVSYRQATAGGLRFELETGSVRAFHPGRGERWTYHGPPDAGFYLKEVTDDAVFLYRENTLVAVDRVRGTRLWQHSGTGPIALVPGAIAVVADGTVQLLDSSDGTELAGIDVADGRHRVRSDGGLVYAGDGRAVYALGSTDELSSGDDRRRLPESESTGPVDGNRRLPSDAPAPCPNCGRSFAGDGAPNYCPDCGESLQGASER